VALDPGLFDGLGGLGWRAGSDMGCPEVGDARRVPGPSGAGQVARLRSPGSGHGGHVTGGRNETATIRGQNPYTCSALAQVAAATSSTGRPIALATAAPTSGTSAGRFGLPRWGTGAR
jgi:hypothetical protein